MNRTDDFTKQHGDQLRDYPHAINLVPCPLCGVCKGDPCVPVSLDRPHLPRLAVASAEARARRGVA